MSEEFDESSDPERWDEFQWEKFMKERDEATDRFTRFMEEHSDDPDLSSILAREIGMPPGFFERLNEEEDFSPQDYEDEGEGWKTSAGMESEELFGSPTRNSRSDALYRKAFEFAVDSIELLQSLPMETRKDHEIQEAFSQALLPAAKIANAWDDGSDDVDMLGYRIAAYKRGLSAANRSLELMGKIRERRILDEARLVALINLGTEVRNGIAFLILEVRKRFDEE